MADKDFAYAGVSVPPGPSVSGAVLLHARLYLLRCLAPRALWPYALIALAVAVGALGLVRLSLADAGAFVAYVKTFALRGVALVALGLGTAAIRADTDAGTMTPYLMRPRAAIGLPLGRWLAVWTTSTLLGWLMCGAVLASSMGTPLAPPAAYALRMFVSVPLAAAAYAAIFLLIAASFRAGAAIGLVWLVVVDLVTGSLSGNLSLLAPSHHLGVLCAAVPEHGLWADGEGQALAGAALGLGLLAVAALTGVVLRFRGDPPR